MANKSWKDYLLKSSLPLEYEISKILSDLKYDIWGDYKYSRSNESGDIKQFSVDWLAVNSMHTVALNSSTRISSAFIPLIECKYTHPGNSWIFIPHSERSDLFNRSPIICNDFRARSVITDKKILRSFYNDFNTAYKGVEIQSNDVTSYPVDRGINQLRYALPSLTNYFITLIDDQPNTIDLDFICPILVTTADLYLLKKDTDLEIIRTSDELSDVTEQIDSLIVHEHNDPEFQRFSSIELNRLSDENPDLYNDIIQLDNFKSEQKYSSRRTNELGVCRA